MASASKETILIKNFAYTIFISKYVKSFVKNMDDFADKNKFLSSISKLGFNVREPFHSEENEGEVSWSQLCDFIEKFTLTQFPADLSSVMLVISCHADEDGICSSDGRTLPFTYVEHAIVRNPFLAGKPKFIIYSCCEGNNAAYYDPSVFLLEFM